MNYIKINQSNQMDFASVLPEIFSKEPYISLGAYEPDGSVCGAVALSFDGAQYDIDWLYVAQKKRLMGIGLGLVKEVKHMISEIGLCPIHAQFDTLEESGLYPFFLSISNSEFLVNVDYSHDRYVIASEDFIEAMSIEKEARDCPETCLFWDMEESLREKALSEAARHLVITDEGLFVESCEKPLCIAVNKDEEILAFMLVQNDPSGGLYLSCLYSREAKALMSILNAAADEVKRSYGARTIIFDAVTSRSESVAVKLFPKAIKHPIYEADL